MTRRVRTPSTLPVAPATPLAPVVAPEPVASAAQAVASAGTWPAWPWGAPDAQAEAVREWIAAFTRNAQSSLYGAAGLDELLATQAGILTSWIDQVLALQSSWLELTRALATGTLLPFGWKPSKAAAALPADARPGAALAQVFDAGRLSAQAVLQQWIEGWKPGHTEEFVA